MLVYKPFLTLVMSPQTPHQVICINLAIYAMDLFEWAPENPNISSSQKVPKSDQIPANIKN